MSRSAPRAYRVLGEVSLTLAGTAVEISAAKPRLLLTLLAIRPREVVSSDQLIDELWEGAPPESSRTLLHGYVADLRRVLEPDRPRRTPARILRTQPSGYVLDCDPQDVDAHAFERLIRQARDAFHHGDVVEARTRLEQALALWEGPPFGALGDVPALQPHRVRLQQLHVSAIEDRVMLDLRMGRGDAALVSELDSLVAEHPLRERLWAALMLAMYRLGRQADALTAYQRVARLLREELGADPGTELSRTYEAILRHDTALEAAPPVLQVLRPPQPPTALVGRRDQLERLCGKASESRLVTLAGPGGCGKTRLAQEVARSFESTAPVAWVDLAPTRQPSEVAAATMMALGVVEQPSRDPLATIIAQVADRELVLVFDNCEHQLPACRDVIGALLAGCAALRIIATSRVALRRRGEVRWHVPPLTVPAESADLPAVAATEAVQLFVDRARDVRPGFTLTPGNAEAVGAICRRVEGIPLAIELAAAWVAFLGLPAIRDQLAHPLDFLTRGSPSAPGRQQTLRATIEWSHHLLEAEDRRVLAELSVFAGRFSLEAAIHVCHVNGDTNADHRDPTSMLDRLANLQAASLITAVDPGESAARFRMLDTIRQFGHEQLVASGRSEVLHERHATWIQDLARRAEAGLYGPDLGAWLARLEDAHADVRAALNWSLSVDRPGIALDTAGALSRYWMARAHIAEGRRWLRGALDADDWQRPSARVRALLAVAFLASLHYDLPEAREAAAEALALVRAAGHVRGTAWALGLQGLAAAVGGDAETAVSSAQEALRLPGISSEPLARAWALNFMALGFQAGGQYEDQRAALTESLVLCRQVGDPMGVEWALGYGGSATYALGRPEEALTQLHESLQLSIRIGNWWGMARNLAAVALASGPTTTGRDQMRRSLETFGRLGDRAGVAFCLRAVAGWLGQSREPGAAASLISSADDIGADVRHVPVLGHLADHPLHDLPASRSPGVGVTEADPASTTARSIEDAVTTGVTALEVLDPSLGVERPQAIGS